MGSRKCASYNCSNIISKLRYCDKCYKTIKRYDYYCILYRFSDNRDDFRMGVLQVLGTARNGVLFFNGVENTKFDPIPLDECPLCVQVRSPKTLTFIEAKTIVEHPACRSSGTLLAMRMLDHAGLITYPVCQRLENLFRPPNVYPIVSKKQTFQEITAWYLARKKAGYAPRLTLECQLNTQPCINTILKSMYEQWSKNEDVTDWDEVRPICMSCLESTDANLHFCSLLQHCFCEDCFTTVLQNKIPNKNALKCVCDGMFTLEFIKPKLTPGWLVAYEHSIIASIIPLAYCSWCLCVGERNLSSMVHVCPFCSNHTCCACFDKFSDDHECQMLINTESKEVLLKCANRVCGLTGIIESHGCMKIHCIACGKFTCGCCFQDITIADYKHFCRSLPADAICTNKNCKHCYCWPNIEVARTATPIFLTQHPHLARF